MSCAPSPSRGSSGDEVPTVDLHLHQERSARLNQLRARAGHERLVDWAEWRQQLSAIAPGLSRLRQLWASEPTLLEHDSPEAMFARFQVMLTEAAAAGAILAEVRIGNETMLRPGTVELFRAAEESVRIEHQKFHGEIVAVLKLWDTPERVDAALNAALASGAGGIDLLYVPYDAEAHWAPAYRLAEKAAAGGLGVSVHAGEFSTSNIAAALAVPGISRIGHAVHTVVDPRLLDQLQDSGVAVECCLTSNVVLGAVGELQSHPLRVFHERGIPIVLGTDNPLQFGTTIRAEYELARSLGLTDDDLLNITRDAISRSFASAPMKANLLSGVETMARRGRQTHRLC